MIHEKYKNKRLYHNLLEGFLNKKITALELQKRYWIQRDVDIDKNKAKGRSFEYYKKMIANLTGADKEFEEQYSDKLYEHAWSQNCLEILKEYEEAAKRLDIKGEMFFMGIWNFIDEYIREYNPSDAEYFNPKEDVDEKELEEKIRAAYGVLERNKNRWLDLKE